MSLVCVDVGTSVVKAVAYDDAGREHALARRPSPVRRPVPGHAEQDPHAVWEAVVAAVREVLAAPGVTTPRALGLTAQGDGAWLVDEAGQPTGPALLWNDGRAAGVVAGWERDGVLADGFAIGGNRVTAGHANALLAWLHTHDEAGLARAARLLTCGGWVHQRLTGEAVVEESDASAPFLDIRTRAWSDKLLELYGLERYRHLLPPLRRDDERVTPLATDAAGVLGLPAGLPVVLAPYDVGSTALGAAAVAAGDTTCILGTTVSTQTVVDRVAPAVPGSAGAGITVALGAGDRWLRAHATLAGGELLLWAADLLGLPDAEAVLALAAEAPVGAAGLRFLPHLSPAGERAPFVDAAARGSLHGLTFGHGRPAVARAVVEGMALSVRECLDLLVAERGARPAQLVACGGGAGSALLVQALADATGVAVARCRDREVGARGAALVAAVALGEEPDLATAAARHVVYEEPVHPDGGHDWDARLAEQRALRAVVAPTWREPS